MLLDIALADKWPIEALNRLRVKAARPGALLRLPLPPPCLSSRLLQIGLILKFEQIALAYGGEQVCHHFTVKLQYYRTSLVITFG